jgi:hypothetical protein
VSNPCFLFTLGFLVSSPGHAIMVTIIMRATIVSHTHTYLPATLHHSCF